jgi:uncharacterized protein (DUF58 family)
MHSFGSKQRASSPGAVPAENLADVLAEVRRIEIQSSRLVTDVLAGGYRSTFRGAGVEFADVREYVEGDDPRSVDWNVTARFGRPFVKRFVEERELTIVFAVDSSARMDGGLGAWSLRQTAARFCALLGLAAIANNDRVGCIAGSGRAERVVMPRKGAGHVLRIVRDCLVQRSEVRHSDVSALVAAASRSLRRRAVVFLLSHFDGALDESVERILALGNRRHDLVAVRLLPRELHDPPRALLRVCDPADGRLQLVDFADERTRAEWQQRVRDWRRRGDAAFGRAAIDCIDVEVPRRGDLAAIARPVLRFFRRRELRAVKR